MQLVTSIAALDCCFKLWRHFFFSALGAAADKLACLGKNIGNWKLCSFLFLLKFYTRLFPSVLYHAQLTLFFFNTKGWQMDFLQSLPSAFSGDSETQLDFSFTSIFSPILHARRNLSSPPTIQPSYVSITQTNTYTIQSHELIRLMAGFRENIHFCSWERFSCVCFDDATKSVMISTSSGVVAAFCGPWRRTSSADCNKNA